MARFKMKANGDLFEEDPLGSYNTLAEAAERAEEVEEDERYFGYEIVVEDTLMRISYFYSNGEWFRVV